MTIKLNTKVDDEVLKSGLFDHVVIATGVVPRDLAGKLDGADAPNVMSAELLSGAKEAGIRLP